MSFPTVEDRQASNDTTASDANRIVLAPATVAEDELLLIFLTAAGAAGSTTVATWPSGFTQIMNYTSQNAVLCVSWKQADGDEGGASLPVEMTNAISYSAATVLRITGWADPGVQAPEWGGFGQANNSTPNPGAATPTGGADDYLWVAHYAQQGSGSVSYPANYSNGMVASVASQCHIATCERLLNASSEDPGAFSSPASTRWAAGVVMVHPGALGLGGGGGGATARCIPRGVMRGTRRGVA